MAASGNRPGFFDTFRAGWAPARRSAGGRKAARARAAAPASGGSTTAPSAPGAPRRSRGRAGASRGNGAPAARSASPQLVRRKEELSREYARLQWDLGGIAYEMARRDHYRLEVLNARAARLQEVDAELGQIERLLKLDEAGAAGTCPNCGSLQARGAAYCWKCGKELTPETTAAPAAAATQETKAEPQPAPAAKPAPPSKPINRPQDS